MQDIYLPQADFFWHYATKSINKENDWCIIWSIMFKYQSSLRMYAVFFLPGHRTKVSYRNHPELSTNPYFEKRLEFLCKWVDDLASEEHRFQYFTRNPVTNEKHRKKIEDSRWEENKKEGLTNPDAPQKIESLHIALQTSW